MRYSRIPLLSLAIGVALLVLPQLPAIETAGTEIPLSAFSPSGQEVSRSPLSLPGEKAQGWIIQTSPNGKNPGKNPGKDFLCFKVSTSTASSVPADKPLYLKLSYLDKGYGKLSVAFLDTTGKWAKTTTYTAASLLDTGKKVISYQLLPASSARPVEIRVSLDKPKTSTASPSLSIIDAALSQQPYDDAHFRYLLEEGWRRPYTGPCVPADNTTLRGKIMVGYQGWFRTPNDPDHNGWSHWGTIDKGEFGVDMWPDTTQYPPETLDKVCDVLTKSGKQAYLFSSGWPEVVRTHFRWMRENGIDGAFLQRFLGAVPRTGNPEWVLSNVREAANREGRVWAVEYDVSGMKDSDVLERLKSDWIWLVDTFGLLKDKNYAREQGKPVVFIWGLPVTSRNFSPSVANSVVDFFKNDPKYGGNYVNSGGGEASKGPNIPPAWVDHYKKNNGVLFWMSKSYDEDQSRCRSWGVDYYPHVWPGFSSSNLKHRQTDDPAAFQPRGAGSFLTAQLDAVQKAGCDHLFVGMFDEYNEGTAIMPMTDDAPATPLRPGVILRTPARGEHTKVVLIPSLDLAVDELPASQSAKAIPAKSTAPGNPPTGTEVAFEGEILPPASGKFSFSLVGAPGDSAMFQVGKEKLRIRNFADLEKNPQAGSISIELKKGEMIAYSIIYTHHTSPGRVQLLWEGPQITREVVPASALFDAWGHFLNNEGKSPDHWMNLLRDWKKSWLPTLGKH
jgi:hypothetical protein